MNERFAAPHRYRVCLVAVPDAAISTLSGLYDVLNAFTLMRLLKPGEQPPFHVEIVGRKPGILLLSSGVSAEVQRGVDEIQSTDIVIVPSLFLAPEGWTRGRYPDVVAWLARMHHQGAILCSACSGIFLLAETGLFSGKDATVHFTLAPAFCRTYPDVLIHPERVLVISGLREELISSGASVSWHDMVLYLIARFAGASAAQEVARMFALQWHQDGLTPYIVFDGNRNHNDAEIHSAQEWLETHSSVSNPVQGMIDRSRLSERTFKRRFTLATGLAPIAYVQRLRVEGAKRRLERTALSVEEISWQVGYEEPAFFRRLFKRTTGLSPAAYRKRFCIPGFVAEPQTQVPSR